MPVIGSLGSASAGGFGAAAPYHQPAIVFGGGGLSLRAYKWDDINGIGEQYPAPPGTYLPAATLPRGPSVVGNPTNPRIPTIVNAPSVSGSGYNSYEWNGRRGGFVKKYEEPAVYTNFAYMQQWNKDRTRVATGTSGTSSGYFSLYSWSDAGYGVKLSNSGSVPQASPGNGIQMITSPNGEWWIQVGASSSSRVQPYPFATATNLSVRTSVAQQSSVNSSQSIFSMAFHPTEGYVLYTTGNNVTNNGPFWGCWTWNNSTGFTANTAGRVYPGSTCNGNAVAAFNSAGTHVVACGALTVPGRIGYISVGLWNGSGLISLMAEPASGATLSGGIVTGVSQVTFNAKETHVLVSCNVAPFYAIHRWSNTTGLGVRLSVPDLGATSTLVGKFI